jgi:hypothetical protein
MPSSIGDFMSVKSLITSAEFRVYGRERRMDSRRASILSACWCIHFSRWSRGLDSETPSPVDDHNASSAATNFRISLAPSQKWEESSRDDRGGRLFLTSPDPSQDFNE